jgi:nicotinamidase-related amidase
VKTLVSADAVIIAGQAASHCVKSTVDDLLDEISRLHDRSLAPKLYLLTDCMSSVAVPDGKGGFVADFTPQTEAAFERYRAAGMHLVRSTDPLESWPGMKLS